MEAVQARSICELEIAFAVSPAGTDGNVVSPVACVVAEAVARAEGRPVQERLRNAVDLPGYVRALSGQGAPDLLTAALLGSAPGAVARGARYEGLPGTVARLLASDAAGFGATPLDRGVLARAEEEMDGPVEGSYTARLEVAPR